MPHKGTVDSLRNIVVEFLAESLHKYAKVNLSHRFMIHSPKNVWFYFFCSHLNYTIASFQICAKWIRQKKKAVSGKNQSRRVKDIQNKLEDCLKLFSEIGVCICHSSSLLEDRFQVVSAYPLGLVLKYNVNLWQKL